MNQTHSAQKPSPVSSAASELQKLKHMGELQQYRIHLLKQVELQMQELAKELQEDSIQAAAMLTNMQKQFREVEMQFLSESRRKLSVQSNKVSEVCIQSEKKSNE